MRSSTAGTAILRVGSSMSVAGAVGDPSGRWEMYPSKCSACDVRKGFCGPCGAHLLLAGRQAGSQAELLKLLETLSVSYEINTMRAIVTDGSTNMRHSDEAHTKCVAVLRCSVQEQGARGIGAPAKYPIASSLTVKGLARSEKVSGLGQSVVTLLSRSASSLKCLRQEGRNESPFLARDHEMRLAPQARELIRQHAMMT
eukprot:1156134-Pelagomonas_calceolata.AAC.4